MSDPEKSEQPESESPPPPKPASYRWPVTIISIALILLAGYIATIFIGRDVLKNTADSAANVANRVGTVAEKFKQGRITETFISQLPEIASTGSGNLELATLKATELFRRENIKTIAWDYISLGTTVTEIRVPVTYRFHLKLSDPWRLDIEGKSCIVQAPKIRATQPPAIHTDQLVKLSDEGWLRFDERKQLDELEKSITPILRVYARDPLRVNLVREECRKVVANFVRDWLLREEHWRTDRFSSITVVFADESTEIVESPTLELQPEEEPLAAEDLESRNSNSVTP